jgi:hypothetical protein
MDGGGGTTERVLLAGQDGKYRRWRWSAGARHRCSHAPSSSSSMVVRRRCSPSTFSHDIALVPSPHAFQQQKGFKHWRHYKNFHNEKYHKY